MERDAERGRHDEGRNERIDYNAISAEYAKHRRVHPEVLRKLLETTTSGSENVLEVGCGTGNYITVIQSITGCPCHGVDPSEKMLNLAHQHNPLVTFQVGRGEQLPFADNTFTVTFSVDVIHHVAFRADYYQEAWRVLKSGGTVCTVTESEMMIRQRLHSHYFPDAISVELGRYPAVRELMTLMGKAGFANVHEDAVQIAFQVSDIQPYRDKAFSSLHFISEAAFRRGIERMEQDLSKGPLQAVSWATLLWGTKP